MRDEKLDPQFGHAAAPCRGTGVRRKGAVPGWNTARGCGSKVSTAKRDAGGARAGARFGDHRLVAEMDAVEIADGKNRAAVATGSRGVAKNAHDPRCRPSRAGKIERLTASG